MVLDKKYKNKIVLFVLPSLAGGGAERVYIQIANLMLTKVGEVHVLCLTDKGPLKNLISPKVKIHTINTSRMLFAIPGIAKKIKLIKPDILFSTMTHTNLATLIAALFVKNYFKTSVIQEVALFSQGRGLLDNIISKFLKPFYIQADHIMAISENVAVELKSIIGLNIKIDVIPNPIDLKKIREQATKGSAQHPWISNKNYSTIVAIGRLAPEKDFSTLLKAFAIAHKSLSKLRLIVVGEGSMRASLIQESKSLKIAEYVNFVGYQDNPYRLLANADLFVLSSVAEGFSLVLAEALALGRRTVITRCGKEPIKMLDNGKLGGIVDTGEPTQMAISILEWLQKSANVCQINKQLVSYDPDNILSLYLSYIENK